MKNKYEEMKRKELIKVAKTFGVKNRNKMTKEMLLQALATNRKPLEKIKEIENTLKKQPILLQDEPHIEFLPQEPGNVFVSWGVDKNHAKNKQGVLKIFKEGKEYLSLDVNIFNGSGYIRVDEGKELKAKIGYINRGKFREIISSPSISVPSSKPSESKKVEFGKVGIGRKTPEKFAKVDKKMEQEKRKLAKEGKEIKYLKYPRK